MKKRKVGRPNLYTHALGVSICKQLSEGKSLKSVCQQEGMPNLSSVYSWFFQSNDKPEYKEFLEMYARAKEESADALAEEILDISDETISVIKSGAEKKSSAYAQAQRLRVDTRKFIMAKMKPKKYGEKQDFTSDGKEIKGNIIILKNFKDATNS